MGEEEISEVTRYCQRRWEQQK